MSEKMKRCPKCSARNDPAAVVCSLCNASLGAAAETYEPRLWQEGKQRFRGEGIGSKEETPAPAGTGERHFLVAPLGEPIRLDLSQGAVTVGREDTCQVKVASASVSRKHAEVSLKGDPARATLRDLGSQNGTFVNGGVLEGERPLADGDVVKLGDLVVVYKRLAPGEDETKLKGYLQTVTGTSTVRMAAGEKHDPPGETGAIEGDAGIIQVHEVLRRLGGLHANGVLDVDMNGIKGTMRLVDGKVTTASYAGLDALPAIQAMASLTKGRYRFMPDRVETADANAATQALEIPKAAGEGKAARPPTNRLAALGPHAQTGSNPSGGPSTPSPG
ncbi:FHA domain-containing protein [bacterium]|nr:FHA domain-containing protein [bacterium]